jgi:hypothetical protein
MSDFFTGKTYKGMVEITSKTNQIILNCISKKETHYFFNAAYIKDNKLFATEGRCMIVLSIPKDIEIEEGYYYPVKIGFRNHSKYFLIPYKLDVNFPNVEKTIFDYSQTPDMFNYLCQYTNNLQKNSALIFKIFLKIGLPIDLKYFEVLKYFGSFKIKHISEKPILFYNDEIKYIVMPMLSEKA